MRSLQGAVVAVTGASSGIGRECAVAFAREGARVAITARRQDRLEAVAEAIAAAGSEAFVMLGDVSRREDVRRFIEGTVARFGRLDVLVNNAGYGVRGRVEETPAEAYERLMAVNFLGTVYGCEAALPILRRQRNGVIINVSSIVGHRALPGGAAYAATKAAQISLTEALRVELRGTGVHACSVHPIGTDTEFGDVAARESPGQPGSGPIGPQQPAMVVARAIVACARKPRPEVYPYLPSRALVWLNALFPSLVDWMAYRAGRRSGRL
jgi:NAD(P)-dependent dehydrogenase (short-subunit alcohol dehydrogenase family)